MRERSHPFGFLCCKEPAGQLDFCEFRQKMVVGECEKKLMGLTHVDLPGLYPSF